MREDESYVVGKVDVVHCGFDGIVILDHCGFDGTVILDVVVVTNFVTGS